MLLGLCTLAHGQDAAALKAKYESLRGALAKSQFQRPLTLDSVQNSDDLRGEVYAVIEQPFKLVEPALQSADHWCELLILHLNVKNCTYAGKPPAVSLNLMVGRKIDQPLDDAYKLAFNFNTSVVSADYLQVQMSADSGPMSTHDYRMVFEAVPLDERRSFVHLSYAYAYGTAGRIAMQAYLATAGRGKVGFSITGRSDDGKPIYIDGVRGVAERNTMRYYLAIEAYLASLSAPPSDRQEKRLREWYAGTERSPVQLHEMDLQDYLDMKRREIQRQQAGTPAQ